MYNPARGAAFARLKQVLYANMCEVKYEDVPDCPLMSGTGATTLPPPKSYSSRGDSSPMYQLSRTNRSMRLLIAVHDLWYLRPPNVSAKYLRDMSIVLSPLTSWAFTIWTLY